MHRRDINEVEFAIIETEITDKQIFPGDVAIITGKHRDHGQIVLVQAGGLYVAIADDPEGIHERNDPIEGDA